MKHTPELRAHIVAEYVDGASSIQLSRTYGVGASTILRWLDDAGVERRPAQKPPTFCKVDGCGEKHHARGYCKRHHGHHVIGYTPRNPSTPIHLEDVEWLAETGEVWERAVERLGVKPNTLERHLERANRRDLLRKLQRRTVAA